MKYFNLILRWSVALGAFFLSVSATLTEADPTDDFSISLGYSSEKRLYRLISEREIIEILKDRLDLFPKSQIPALARHLVSLCKQYRFDPAFILSLIEVESGFRTKVVSSAGAIGLMQVQVGTANFVVQSLKSQSTKCNPAEGCYLKSRQLTAAMLTDPFLNTAVGITYLAWLRDHFKEFTPYHVLAAYNAGPTKVSERMNRKSRTGKMTTEYFHSIRRRMPGMRFYRPIKSETRLRKVKFDGTSRKQNV